MIVTSPRSLVVERSAVALCLQARRSQPALAQTPRTPEKPETGISYGFMPKVPGSNPGGGIHLLLFRQNFPLIPLKPIF